MIRRGLAVGGVAMALMALGAGFAAATNNGSRLAFMQWSAHPRAFELRVANADGSASERIAGGGPQSSPLPFPLSSVAWTPDGSLLAFVGLSGLAAQAQPQIFTVPADGGAPQLVPGTANGFDPVISPKDGSIAFLRMRGHNSSWVSSNGKHGQTFARTSIWISDLDGGSPRRLTPWRARAVAAPSSFSPDGTRLAITFSPGSHGWPKAVALNIASGTSQVITEKAVEPMFSPDGSMIALLRLGEHAFHNFGPRHTTGVETTSDLYVTNAAGTNLTRLTRSPTIEESPSWDPSGQRLAFVRLSRAHTETAMLGIGDSLIEANADGSCETKVLSAPKLAFATPAWQPGPGREAGPISC